MNRPANSPHFVVILGTRDEYHRYVRSARFRDFMAEHDDGREWLPLQVTCFDDVKRLRGVQLSAGDYVVSCKSVDIGRDPWRKVAQRIVEHCEHYQRPTGTASTIAPLASSYLDVWDGDRLLYTLPFFSVDNCMHWYWVNVQSGTVFRDGVVAYQDPAFPPPPLR